MSYCKNLKYLLETKEIENYWGFFAIVTLIL